MTDAVVVRCPAKINTRLEVGARREDGYHELDLEFVELALSDTLELAPAAELSLEVVGAPAAEVPVDDNLVLRAARALRREVGGGGARMRLTKRIPSAAGLGGGSSDAAGALVGLLRLWEASVEPDLLARVALEIGSDVPFFLEGGRQAGKGRGEVLRPLPDLPEREVVLVVDPQGLGTRAVFEELRRQRAGAHGALTSRKGGTNFGTGVPEDGWINDLLPAAVALSPALGKRLEAVRRAVPAGLVGLTGSGPTIVAVLEPGVSSADCRDRLEKVLPAGVRVAVTRTMGVAERRATRFSRHAG